MWLLKGFTILEELSIDEITQLEAFCQEKKVTTGEILFAEWDNANAMYFLKQGAIEITKELNGEPMVLGIIEGEDLLWEMALFSENGKRMAGAIATTDCTLVTILAFSIQQLINTKPEILEKMKGLIEKRMYENKIKQISYWKMQK